MRASSLMRVMVSGRMMMEKMTNKFSRVVIGACFSGLLLGSTAAQAERTKAIEIDGKVVPVVDRAGTWGARKGFDDTQAKIFSAKLDPYFMAAYEKQITEISPEAVNIGDNKNTTAAGYGGAVAWQALRGGGISSAGLGHMGLNLLLGMEGNMLKRNQLEQVKIAGIGEVILAKVVKTPSETVAIQTAFTELAWLIKDICGFAFVPEKTTLFAKERWVFARGTCERMDGELWVEAINYRFYPAFKDVADAGFIVTASVQNPAQTSNPFKESPELFRERLKSMLSPDWYYMRGDSKANDGKGEFRVWKNKQEVVFPLPAV